MDFKPECCGGLQTSVPLIFLETPLHVPKMESARSCLLVQSVLQEVRSPTALCHVGKMQVAFICTWIFYAAWQLASQTADDLFLSVCL